MRASAHWGTLLQETYREARNRFNYAVIPTPRGPSSRANILTGAQVPAPHFSNFPRAQPPWNNLAQIFDFFPHLFEVALSNEWNDPVK